MLGAADLIVKVAKGAEGAPSTAKVEAAKDDADGDELPFRLRVIDLGPDADGDRRTTCVAEEAEADEGQRGRKLPPSAKQALAYFANLILAEGETVPPGDGLPLHQRGVREEQWRAECDTRRLSMAAEEKDRDRSFRREAKRLIEAGEVQARSGWVWLGKASADG